MTSLGKSSNNMESTASLQLVLVALPVNLNTSLPTSNEMTYIIKLEGMAWAV